MNAAEFKRRLRRPHVALAFAQLASVFVPFVLRMMGRDAEADGARLVVLAVIAVQLAYLLFVPPGPQVSDIGGDGDAGDPG